MSVSLPINTRPRAGFLSYHTNSSTRGKENTRPKNQRHFTQATHNRFRSYRTCCKLQHPRSTLSKRGFSRKLLPQEPANRDCQLSIHTAQPAAHLIAAKPRSGGLKRGDFGGFAAIKPATSDIRHSTLSKLTNRLQESHIHPPKPKPRLEHLQPPPTAKVLSGVSLPRPIWRKRIMGFVSLDDVLFTR